LRVARASATAAVDGALAAAAAAGTDGSGAPVLQRLLADRSHEQLRPGARGGRRAHLE